MPGFAVEEHVTEQIQIVRDVFGTMVDMHVEPVQSEWKPEQEVVTSAIYFTEPTKGALFVECTVPLAFIFTARLMSIPTPDSVNADVCDAMGELANMIAGNLKALMPANVGISIPSIVRGTDYVLQLRGSVSRSQTVFETEFGPFCLTLFAVPEK